MSDDGKKSDDSEHRSSLKPLDEDELLARLRSGGRMAGVAYVREVTGASLSDAVAILGTFETHLAHDNEGTGDSVGMSAEIIAIGPYSRALAGIMDYSGDLYKATKEGAIVTRRLFGVSEGSSLSRDLAALLGITDPWDFNQHKVDNSRIDIAGLRQFGEKYVHYDQDVEILEALRHVGFEFHFRPEG